MHHQTRHLRTLLLLPALAGAALLYAATVAGVVTDADGEPLLNASVRMLAPDSTYLRGVVTDFDGNFRLTDVKPGKYIIQADYTGYASAERDISVTGDSILDIGAVRLLEKSHMLDEVSVVAVKTQVKVKEDTIEYNADSYQTRPNAVVEDLIKRLPGVEVSSDGTITANGRQVTKILLDGKEFFGDDPTVASKNLPVDIVDKLQVVDRKSDLARLTGVDDGEDETVINLTVKKGRNNGWFGNVEGGYGTDDRYAGAFTINRFWDGNQMTLLGNANNINQVGFNDGNGGRFRHFGADNGINTTQSLGLNFNVGNGEILRVGGNVFYSHSDRKTTEEREREYLLGDDAAFSRSGSLNNDRSHNLRADFRILWKPDSFNTMEVRPRISYNHVNTLSVDSTSMFSALRDLVSRSFNDDHSTGNSLEVGANFIYSHQFASRRGRSFSINAGIAHSNVRQRGDSHSLSEFFATGDPDDASDQLSDDHTWANTLTGRVTWTEPLGNVAKGNFLSVAYRAQYRWNNADKLVDELDPATGDYCQSDILSNRFRNNYFNQDIRVGYKHVAKAYTLDAGLSLVPQMSKSENLIDDARNIPARHTLNFAPYLRYRHKWGGNRSLNVNYFGRSSQPSLTQLQPVADESDPMNIVVGNPLLDPSFRHDIRLRFQDYNAEHQRSIMAMLMGSLTQNSVVSLTDYDTSTGARRTTYQNVNGVWNARAMNMVSMPLGSRKLWLFTSHVMASYDHSVGFNNGLRNNSGSFRLNLSPSIAFRPASLDLELRPFYTLQTTANSLPAVGDMTVHSYGGNFNASWYSPWGIVLNSELTYTGTSGYAAGYDEDTWQWNASVSYQFLRDKSATISLKGYDLLGMKNNIQRNVTANYIDDTRYNTLTRYFMVSLAWTFNTFGKGNEPKSNDMMRHGHGGPPPGVRPPGMR